MAPRSRTINRYKPARRISQPSQDMATSSLPLERKERRRCCGGHLGLPMIDLVARIARRWSSSHERIHWWRGIRIYSRQPLLPEGLTERPMLISCPWSFPIVKPHDHLYPVADGHRIAGAKILLDFSVFGIPRGRIWREVFRQQALIAVARRLVNLERMIGLRRQKRGRRVSASNETTRRPSGRRHRWGNHGLTFNLTQIVDFTRGISWKPPLRCCGPWSSPRRRSGLSSIVDG